MTKILDENGNAITATPPNEKKSGAEAKLQKEKDLIDKNIEEQKRKAEETKKNLIAQRNDFAKDESYFEKYKDLKIDGRNILLRLFVFKEERISPGMIMVPKKDISGRKKFVWENTSYDEKVMPIGKVIKVGNLVENDLIKEGSVVLLPTDEVEGFEKNPEFMHYLQFSQAKGLDPAFDQFEIPQELPSVMVNWGRHIFKHWDNLEPDDDDMMTFLLPETKVMAVWDSEA